MKKGLYRMMNAFFLACIGLFGLGKHLGIASWSNIHIVIMILTVVVLTGFNYMSARGRMWGLLGVLGCIGAGGTAVGLEKVWQFVDSYIHWLFGSPLWEKEWIAGYEILQTFFLSIACYLLQILLEKHFRIKTAVVLMLLVGMVYCFLTKQELSRIGVTFLLVYTVMTVVEWTQRNWKKHRNKSLQVYMLWLMPYFAFYMILLLCMPAPKNPYDWQFFKDIYYRISESVSAFSQNVFSGNREDYDLGLSGFSESGELGEGILPNEREIMTVWGDKGLKTNVYLIGKVYDAFDGSEWVQSAGELPRERYLDSIETVYAVRSYTRDYLQDYLYRTELKVRYRYFNSAYLFAPLKMWSLEQPDKSVSFEETDGSLLFEEKQGFGTEYETEFYQMNLKQEVFDEFLETKPKYDEELLLELINSLEVANDVEIPLEDFQKRKEIIYASYLDEISLSPEVEAYVNQITQDAESDVEKLRAIEKALSGFTYNRMPGKLPETVTDSSTFLDYFLLESKQGYCSHFATAFVLLVRAEGIPARYVQGYCVPLRGNEATVVTSNMAHAWPEVYIDDIGWIPFEPTPGYAKIRYTPWGIRQDDASISTDAGDGYGASGPMPEIPQDGQGTIRNDEGEQIQKADEWSRIFRIVFGAFGIVVGVGVILLFLDILVGKYRYKRLDIQQKYAVEMHRNLQILSWLGMKRQEGETLEEMQKRIPAFGFMEAYEEVLYGEKSVDYSMLQQMKGEQEELLQLLKQKKRRSYPYYWILIKGYNSLLNKSFKMNIL